jgi:hypothetical protein
VSNHASVSFRFSILDLFSISGRACSGSPAQPAVWPGPWPDPALVRAPWRLTPPMRPSSLSHFPFPRNNFPLPLFHLLCRRYDPVDGCRRSSSPEVSSPFPTPLLSLSLSPRRRVWPPGRLPALALAPSPGATPPRLAVPPPRDPILAVPSARSRGAQRVPVRAVTFPRTAIARATFKFYLISFKFSLIYVLRRATIYFKFRFISVLRHMLHRMTIHFNFRLFNVLRRAFYRATIYFKFSLSGVCRRALRRATLYVIFIFNSSVLLRALSRDDSF